MTEETLSALREHSFVKRKPGGRLCRVVRVESERVLVKDPCVRGPFWVLKRTLLKEWE